MATRLLPKGARALADSSKAKIRLRKLGWYWYVLIPGDIPELRLFLNFSDALAKVQREIKGPYK